MLVRVVKSCLVVALGLVLVAGSARATTFLGGSLTFAGFETDFVPFLSNQSVNDTWNFTVPGQIITSLSATTLSPNGNDNTGIKGITFQWDGVGPTMQFTDPVTGVLNSSLVFITTLTAGPHTLFISGTAMQGGGKYGFNIAVTPLPAALVLFGSGLLGLTLLGRRRSPKRDFPQA
jgi:hypothetical protein